MNEVTISKQKNGSSKLRVAAYARVASSTEEQLIGYRAQIRRYTEYIQARPDWECAGLYADEGFSGLTTKNRYAFLKMMKDARDGKIDLVLVKSISRFTRNTVTLLETVRELKALGVGVFFGKENLDTLSADGEMLLTAVDLLAQIQGRSAREAK